MTSQCPNEKGRIVKLDRLVLVREIAQGSQCCLEYIQWNAAFQVRRVAIFDKITQQKYPYG